MHGSLGDRRNEPGRVCDESFDSDLEARMFSEAVMLAIGLAGLASVGLMRGVFGVEACLPGSPLDDLHPGSPLYQYRSPAHPTMEQSTTLGRLGGFPRLQRYRGIHGYRAGLSARPGRPGRGVY